MIDRYVIVLSFGYANIVKDAGVETFSVIYGPEETALSAWSSYVRKHE